MRSYKVLTQKVFNEGDYSLVPIRHQDRYKIMQWRNEQIYHLRQAEPLTKEKQDWYFEHVVAKLFDEAKPDQILFSFLKGEECIGYGGLVHINWVDKNAEVSFIMNTGLEKDYFSQNWSAFLALLEKVGFEELYMHKLYTYAFDLRPHLYPVLEVMGFQKEARLKEHASFNGNFVDVLIHGKWNEGFNLREATIFDIHLTHSWVNNADVRKYSFNKEYVPFENHEKWFKNKLESSDCIYFIAELNAQPVGSFRVDFNESEALISFLLDPAWHGKGLGKKLLWEGILKTKERFPEVDLVGFVLPENMASANLFRKLSFQEEIEADGALKFTFKQNGNRK